MNITISTDELSQILEPMIRKVIREELNILILSPESQLYSDMQTLLQRKNTNDIQLKSHAEVWDE